MMYVVSHHTTCELLLPFACVVAQGLINLMEDDHSKPQSFCIHCALLHHNYTNNQSVLLLLYLRTDATMSTAKLSTSYSLHQKKSLNVATTVINTTTAKPSTYNKPTTTT